jgi:hypothetical protein
MLVMPGVVLSGGVLPGTSEADEDDESQQGRPHIRSVPRGTSIVHRG